MANFLYTIKHNKKEIPLSISFNIKLKKENPYTDEQLVDLLDDLFFDFLALLKNEFADDVQKKIAPQA